MRRPLSWVLGLSLLTLSFGCDGEADPVDGSVDGFDASPDAGTTEPDAGPPPLPPCGTDSEEAAMACVEQSRYEADLTEIAQPRSPGTPHHEAVRELCATRLAALGMDVERHDYGTGVNIVGTLAGTTAASERVLLSAHYDSVPDCAGADDNATGVAGVLEAARVLASTEHARTLVVACWDEEERGLIGSRAYAERAGADGDDLRANLVFEMIGYRDDTPGSQELPEGFDLLFPREVRQIEARESRGDFLAAIGDERYSETVASDLVELGARVGLPVISLLLNDGLLTSPATGDLRRSDHSPFWLQDAPGMMLTDTSEFRYDEYHCRGGPDDVEGLDPVFATQVIQASVGAAWRALSP